MSTDTRNSGGLLPAAEKVRALAEEHAAQADETQSLPRPLVDALAEAGFARHFAPRSIGGAEGSFTELAEAVRIVGTACPATAWCASLFAASGRMAGHLPPAGREELWRDGPDRLIASGLVPGGTAHPADGGWTLSGRWSYVSGVEHAQWLLLCAKTEAQAKEHPRFLAVPRDQMTVVPDWDSTGMRATGSHTVELPEVFVPDHLTFPRGLLMSGLGEGASGCYNVPFQSVGGLTFAAPALGAGFGALEACTQILAGKRRTTSAELSVARASGELDAARSLLDRIAAVLDDAPVPARLAARNARDAAFIAELVSAAVNRLVAAAGTSGLTRSRGLERFWRDATTATTHAALRFETCAQPYAQLLLESGAA